MSSAMVDAALITAYDGLACIGLFVLQTLLDGAPQDQTFTFYRDCLKWYSNDGRCTTVHNAFECFAWNLAMTYELLGRRCVQTHEEYLKGSEQRYNWLSVGLEQLARTIRPERMNFVADWKMDGYIIPSHLVLELASCMSLGYLALWLMLTYGEMTFVLKKIDASCVSSMGRMFSATMIGLDCLRLRLPKKRVQMYQIKDDKQNSKPKAVQSPSQLSGGQEFLDSISLLQISPGLSPNAKAADPMTYGD